MDVSTDFILFFLSTGHLVVLIFPSDYLAAWGNRAICFLINCFFFLSVMFWADIVHYKNCHCFTLVTFAGEYVSKIIKTDLVPPARSALLTLS